MPRTTALILTLLLIPAVTGCGEEEAAPKVVALAVTGAVAEEKAFTWEDLADLGWETFEMESPAGEMHPYTGLLLSTLLAQAGVAETATTLTFITYHGDRHPVPIDQVLACADCAIVSLMGQRLQANMPGFGDDAWVNRVVEIAIG